MDRTSAAARLKKFEGSTSYMYLCTGGEVTAGVGHAIANASDAAKLGWDGPPAAAAVAADYARVAAAGKGLPAPHYEGLTQCRLSADAVDAMLADDIAKFEILLSAQLPEWNTYPEPAQQALFDMAYNLGVGGLLKFPKLLAACAAGQWETAATECRRNGISEARNDETAALFRQAGAA